MAHHRVREPIGPVVVGEFRVFTDPAPNLTPRDTRPSTWTQVSSSSDKFLAVSHLVHLGICMLECTEGRRCLVDCGERVVHGWDLDQRMYNFQTYGRSMRYCVDFFLDSIRQRFPNVRLTSTIHGEGSTRGVTWGSRLQEYNPSLAAAMNLNRIVSLRNFVPLMRIRWIFLR